MRSAVSSATAPSGRARRTSSVVELRRLGGPGVDARDRSKPPRGHAGGRRHLPACTAAQSASTAPSSAAAARRRARDCRYHQGRTAARPAARPAGRRSSADEPAQSRPSTRASTRQPCSALGRRRTRRRPRARASRSTRSSASPPIAADVGEIAWPVAYRNTDRVIPPCHHWSWSSMNDASDHFTTVSRRVFQPGRERRRDVELRGEVRVLADADLDAVELARSARSPRRRRGARRAVRPSPPAARTSARRRPSGSPRARPAAVRRTASGRSCRCGRSQVPCIVHSAGDPGLAPARRRGLVRPVQELEPPGPVELTAGPGAGRRACGTRPATGELRVGPRRRRTPRRSALRRAEGQAADELLLERRRTRSASAARRCNEPAASRLLSVKNWPWRLLRAEVIGRLSPVASGPGPRRSRCRSR